MSNTLEPCILPWVNFCTNPFGRSRPCGYSAEKSDVKVQDSSISEQFNNDVFKKIRRDFMAGRWPSNCRRCEYIEKHQPGHSKKSSEHPYFQRYSQLISETGADGAVPHFPRQIDIRLGTVCNLKCIHCGTGNSSKWLEDQEILGKYENTELIRQDNRWVDHENAMWRDVLSHIDEIEKFNFMGGEPFASRQHARLISQIIESGHAPHISLHYVTNGTLLETSMLEKLAFFKDVTINVSLDMFGRPLEFYRFPIKSDLFAGKLENLMKFQKPPFNIALQWTSSNISMFYLAETLSFFEEKFRTLEFKFCNYVDNPKQLSPQNLPLAVKDLIVQKLKNYSFKYPEIEFYIKHMNAEDKWNQNAQEFHSYLTDLSRVRNIDWRDYLRDFSEQIIF